MTYIRTFYAQPDQRAFTDIHAGLSETMGPHKSYPNVCNIRTWLDYTSMFLSMTLNLAMTHATSEDNDQTM